ncbi:MAG: hypothetical protein WA705_09220 [Candidatus Ozemobacteraceae bacterium]
MSKRFSMFLVFALLLPLLIGCRIFDGNYPDDRDVASVSAAKTKVSNTMVIPVTLPKELVPASFLAGLTKLTSILAETAGTLGSDSLAMNLVVGGQTISFGAPMAYRENADGSITLIFATPLQTLTERGIVMATGTALVATASLNLGGNNVNVAVADLSTQVVHATINEVAPNDSSKTAQELANLQETIQVAQQVVSALFTTTSGSTPNTLIGEQEVVVYEVTISKTGVITVVPTIVKIAPTAAPVQTATGTPVSISAFVTKIELNNYTGVFSDLAPNSDKVLFTDANFTAPTFKFTFNQALSAVPTTFKVKIYDMTNIASQALLLSLGKGNSQVNLSFSGTVLTAALSTTGNLLQPGKVYKTVFEMTDAGALTYIVNSYYTFKTYLPLNTITLNSVAATSFGSTTKGILTEDSIGVTDFPNRGGAFDLTFSQSLTSAPTSAVVKFYNHQTGLLAYEFTTANNTLTVAQNGAILSLTVVPASALPVGTTFNVSFELSGFSVPEGTTVVTSAADVYQIQTFQTIMVDWTGKGSTETTNQVDPALTTLNFVFNRALSPDASKVTGTIKVERFQLGATTRESMYTYSLPSTQKVAISDKTLILTPKDQQLVALRRYVVTIFPDYTLNDIEGMPVAFPQSTFTFYTK